MFCRMMTGGRKRKTGTVPVYLNVYDLTPINGYAYWLGLGAYHSGVQVHGIEYAFGAHDNSSTGISEVEPKKCPGFTFRKSILIGKTDMGPLEVRTFMEKVSNEYSGDTYNLITRNCNHFCKDVCLRLTGKSIPRWVNRLARVGLFCNCVLPADLNDTKVVLSKDEARVQQVKTEGKISKKKRLRSHSSPQQSVETAGSTKRSAKHQSRHSTSPSKS